MDAEPLLTRIAEALQRNRLEAVLIGNSGAAVHGAPVTTLDFDFMFRSTPSNLKKLNRIAEELEARLYVPYELSGMFRSVVRRTAQAGEAGPVRQGGPARGGSG